MYVSCYVEVMATHKSKIKNESHNMKIVRGTEDELATPQFVDNACKIRKEWNFRWSHLYQFFAYEGY